MATRAERGGDTPPQLPEGMTLDELRFVHPQLYPPSMAIQGWEVLLQSDIGGNGAKVSYSLARPVPKILNLDELKRSIGIVDEEGNNLPGYFIGTADSADARKSLGRKIGYEDITDGDGNSMLTSGVNEDETYLMFNFTGFPTAKTMDVLMSLEEQFLSDVPEFADPEEIGDKSIVLVPQKGKPVTIFPAEHKSRTGRIRSLVNAYANVTPQRHDDKVEYYRQEATAVKNSRKYKVYDILDGESVIETARFTLGIGGTLGFGVLGLDAFISSFDKADLGGTAVGLLLIALSARFAKTPIRAVDNSSAIEQVIIEDFNNKLRQGPPDQAE